MTDHYYPIRLFKDDSYESVENELRLTYGLTWAFDFNLLRTRRVDYLMVIL